MDKKNSQNSFGIFMNRVKKNIALFFQDVASGNPIDIAILVGIVILVAAIIGLCISLGGCSQNSGTASSQSSSVSSAAGESYDPTANSINNEQYSGVILQETADAGESYLTDTLFIGDSNTNRMITYGYTDLSNCIGVDSMGVSAVSQLPSVYFSGYSSPVTIVKAVTLMQPRRIIITFGTNNLAWDADTFKRAYTTMIQSLQSAWPYADIIIDSVPPIGQSRSNTSLTQTTVDSFNAALLEVAQELDCKFLNSAEALKDPATGYAKSGYQDTDGFHFNQTGMEAWFKYIRTHAWTDTEDRRPAGGAKIPTHIAAPAPVISENPLDNSSSSGSSSSSSSAGKVAIVYVASGSGSISGATTVNLGESVAFTATPADGSHLVGVTCTDGSLAAPGPNGGSGTLRNSTLSTGTITVTATFAPHAYTAGVLVAPTCVAMGTTRYTCACGTYYDAQDIAINPDAHVFGDTVTNADGSTGHTCTLCGAYEQLTAAPTPTPTPDPAPSSSTEPGDGGGIGTGVSVVGMGMASLYLFMPHSACSH